MVGNPDAKRELEILEGYVTPALGGGGARVNSYAQGMKPSRRCGAEAVPNGGVAGRETELHQQAVA